MIFTIAIAEPNLSAPFQLVVGQSEISPVLLVPMAQSVRVSIWRGAAMIQEFQKSCLGLAMILVLHLERRLT
jgi:hypothetical protein